MPNDKLLALQSSQSLSGSASTASNRGVSKRIPSRHRGILKKTISRKRPHESSNTSIPSRTISDDCADEKLVTRRRLFVLTKHHDRSTRSTTRLSSEVAKKSDNVMTSSSQPPALGSSVNSAAIKDPKSDAEFSLDPMKLLNELFKVQLESANEVGIGMIKEGNAYPEPLEFSIEQNLSQIEQLSRRCTDEKDIKVLKTQERRLRNRQAAFESRRRKLHQAERLELEKEEYASIIADMRMEIQTLNSTITELKEDSRLNQMFMLQQAKDREAEKEQMIQAHSTETSSLMKQIDALTNHIRRLENSS